MVQAPSVGKKRGNSKIKQQQHYAIGNRHWSDSSFTLMKKVKIDIDKIDIDNIDALGDDYIAESYFCNSSGALSAQ